MEQLTLKVIDGHLMVDIWLTKYKEVVLTGLLSISKMQTLVRIYQRTLNGSNSVTSLGKEITQAFSMLGLTNQSMMMLDL